MKPGKRLIDRQQGETPYRVEELIATGDHYQIAGAHDEDRDRGVALRAILYDGESDAEVVAGHRAALKRQWRFLEDLSDVGLVVRGDAWLELDESPIDRPPEPIIVCERIDGVTLYDWICEEHPRGVDPARALAMIGEVADFLAVAHRKKWLWRDFDPRRFVVDDEERLRAVSIGRVIKRGAPLQAGQLEINADYVAPEIREEMTGKLQRPAADIYGVGALMSFLLTGEEPRHRVESPLSYRAYERIQELQMPGIELLLARLLQPLAKKRLGRAEKLRAFCDVDTLPTREMKGFEMCTLPAPWLGLDIENPAENKGLGSSLSSGPLVSVPTAPGEASVAEGAEPNWPIIFGFLAIVVAAAVLAMWL